MSGLARTRETLIVSATALQRSTLNPTFQLKQPVAQAKIEHVLKSDPTFLRAEITIVRMLILEVRFPKMTFGTNFVC